MSNRVELVVAIASAWIERRDTKVTAADVVTFMQAMDATLASLTTAALKPVEGERSYVPAVTVKKSLASPDHIVSMIDGKPYRMLRRHLTNNGLTPDSYRARYNLPNDYPMVCDAYSKTRAEIARESGLGKHRRPEQS